MKKNILLLFSLFILCSLTQPLAAETIEWMTNYEAAVTKSQSQSKPLVLFFTGSDWCTWCKKLEKESLDTTDFASEAGDKFIFLMLDFPMRTKQDKKLVVQNKEIQQKYEIKSFPSLVIVSPTGQKIGITGYRKGGGKEYADHLLKMIEDN